MTRITKQALYKSVLIIYNQGMKRFNNYYFLSEVNGGYHERKI